MAEHNIPQDYLTAYSRRDVDDITHTLPSGEGSGGFAGKKAPVRDAHGKFAKSAGGTATQKDLDALKKKQNAELAKEFGPNILKMSLADYKKTLPAKTRAATLKKLVSVITRQIAEQQKLQKQIKHDDFGPDNSLVHHGIKGMKWGVRMPRGAGLGRGGGATKKATASKGGAAASKASVAGKPVVKSDATHVQKATGAHTNPGIKAATGEETSSARYDRLVAQVKAGKHAELSDQDLKFVNARTDALNKVKKLDDSGWFKKTAIEILQETAKKQAQEVANQQAEKLIAAATVKIVAKKAASAAVKAAV